MIKRLAGRAAEEVSMLYLLRAALADRPGSLASVARAISRCGGDILQVQVIERGEAVAVDDFFIRLPAHCAPATLLASLADVPQVQVDTLAWIAPDTRWHPDLDLLGELAQHPPRALEILVEMAPEVFRASFALSLTRVHDGAVVLHASAQAPHRRAGVLPWALPCAAAGLLPDGYAIDGLEPMAKGRLAAAPVPDTDTVVVVARPGGPSFRAIELLRLARLTELAVALTGRCRDPTSCTSVDQSASSEQIETGP